MFRHLRLTPAFCLRLLCAATLGLALAPLLIGVHGPGDSALANPPGWIELPNSPLAGNAQRHDDIDFLDAERGWLVNGDGEVWNTKDAGLTWNSLTNTGVYNRCVGVGDSLHAWIGTLFQSNGDALQATSDGGYTWSVVPLPTPKPRGICGLWVVGDSIVNGVGAYYGTPRYIRSANRGVTWTVKDMTAYCGALVDTYFWSPDSGLACGSTAPGSTRKPRVLMTTDGGATWSIRWTGTRTRELCWKISFVNRNIGFIAIENLGTTGSAYFLKTTDGGLTWTEHLFESTYRDCEGIGFLTEQIGWIGGWDFPTEETTDGGLTWHAAGFGYNTNRFRFLSPTLAYAVGTRVYKYIGDVTAVGNAGGAPPALLLGQNRPNPFGASTTIAYRVTEAGPVTLRLFDAQGRELRTLFSAPREPGGYTTTLDAANLAAGAYFYQLTTPAGVETKKMFLVR